MTREMQDNTIEYMRQCKLGEGVIAKFMAFIKNEDLWQGKTYTQLFDYVDDLYICENEGCENVEHIDDMTDTLGKVNGGLGLICPSCLNDGW